MNGATSFDAHSRTDCSRSFCSLFRLKSIIASPTHNAAIFASHRLSRATRDVHRRSAPQIERGGRAGYVGGVLEMVVAAEQLADLSRARVGIRLHRLRDDVQTDAHVDVPGASRRSRQPLERPAID